MKALKWVNIGITVSAVAQGDSLYWPYGNNLDCDAAEAAFASLSTAQQLAQSKTEAQLNAMGYTIGAERNCSGFNVTVSGVDNSGAPPITPVDPDPQPATPLSTTRYVANPNTLNLALENNGVLWRIRKVSSLTIEPNEHEYLFINGTQQKIGNDENAITWGGYDYQPGDRISLMYVIATSLNTDTWIKKQQQLITFGLI